MDKQEPVAWLSEGGDVSRSKRYMDEMGFKCNPLYTAPPKKEWVGLTDQEIHEIDGYEEDRKMYRFARALRQALDTEPEALRLADALDDEFTQGRISNHNGRKAAVELRRLALKQWVGLTEEEIQNLGYLSEKFDASNSEWFDRWGFARAIEAKLKEKNT
jgi:hypothetical protein